jgi:hypothetical protein
MSSAVLFCCWVGIEQIFNRGWIIHIISFRMQPREDQPYSCHHLTMLNYHLHCCLRHGEHAIIKLLSSKLLNSINWIVWQEQMFIMLKLCKVYEYMQGVSV